MAFDRSVPLALTCPLAAVAAFVADEPEAAADAAADYGACPYGDAGYAPEPPGDGYYNYCEGADYVASLAPRTADAIPTDGVLVLQTTSGGGWDPAVVEGHIALEVTQDGVPFPGTLAATDIPDLLTWRPDAAWTAGATYDVAGTLSNPDAPAQCVEPSIPFAFSVVVGSEPAAALEPSTLTGTAELIVNPIVSLETLACCPDVSPMLNFTNCGGATLDFDPALCTPLVASGSLHMDLTGTPSATGPTAAQVHYSLTIDGAVTHSGLPAPAFQTVVDKPFCATVTARDLGSGTTVTGPMACFGAEFADRLGTHDIAPPDSFTCSLRQCEPTSDAWDLEACTPLDPDHPNEPEPEKGCDCSTGGPADPALLLGLAGLLAARRRRRR